MLGTNVRPVSICIVAGQLRLALLHDVLCNVMAPVDAGRVNGQLNGILADPGTVIGRVRWSTAPVKPVH